MDPSIKEKSDKVHFRKIGKTIIDINYIMYCCAQSCYTDVFLYNGEKFVECLTLQKTENILPNRIFLRIHKSHIININYLVKCQLKGSATVVMSDGKVFNVAETARKKLVQMLTESLTADSN